MAEPTDVKQEWEAPTLTELGDIETLTAGVTGAAFDGSGQLPVSGP